MQYRLIGKAGIRVSEVGVGCGGLGGPGKEDLESALRYAVDMGVNLFDTAGCYTDGKSEAILGKLISSIPRDRIVIASKFGTVRGLFGGHKKNFSCRSMRRQFQASLKRLRTDFIDIYQLHNPPIDCLRRGDLWAELERMVEAGQIRCYGVSVDREADANAFMNGTGLQSLQMIGNPLNQEFRSVLSVIERRSLGLLVKVPLAGGTFTNRFGSNWPGITDSRRRRWGESNFSERIRYAQLLRPILQSNGRSFAQGALAWLLTISPRTIPISGITTLEALRETVGAVGLRLTQEEMLAIENLEEGALKTKRFPW